MRRFEWPRRALLGACVRFLPMFAYAETSSWSAWLASQIQQHPEVLAAREQLLGSNASADALEQPLYNPELSTDLERNEEEDNYRVGVQQTIDWWDRRGARRQQAGFMPGCGRGNRVGFWQLTRPRPPNDALSGNRDRPLCQGGRATATQPLGLFALGAARV